MVTSAAIFAIEIAADNAALAQHQVAVLDHRRDAHRVKRLVFVRRHAVVDAPIIELELVIEPQLFTEPNGFVA